jgi:hypothetical protein
MMTTENNKMEEGKVDEGMRQRVATHPSALSSTNKALSMTSKMYDVDGDGKLDVAEQAMRDMDTANRGYLTNEKVYKVMLEQMKLQQEVFSLKRMSMVFLAIVFILSLATLGTSFAAAMLAKDTNVENGNLVAKDGGGVVGTSNVAATFTVTEGEDGSGRSLQNTFTKGNGDIWITRADADEAWRKCRLGQSVFLKRSCSGGTVTVDVPMCSNSPGRMEFLGPKYYSYPSAGETIIDCSGTNINCSTSKSCPCTVSFPTNTQACDYNTNMVVNTVNLRSAANFAILAKTGITTVPSSLITGNIAVSPIAAAAMVGFDLALDSDLEFSTDTFSSGVVQIIGKAYASNYGGLTPSTLTTAVSDMLTAYIDAEGRLNSDASRKNINTGTLGGVNFGGPDSPLTPGVYTFTTSVGLTGDIHLQGSASDIFIIQIAQNLVQGAGFSVFLDPTWVGTPKAENIFWQVAGYVSVGAGAHMEGIILGKTAVTFISGSSLNGRILAQTAVTLGQATITQQPPLL